MKLSELKTNPTNPRTIKDDKFKKLVQSIKDFPEMMEKRPIVCVTDSVDGKLYPLGGNMRLKALQELKYKEIPDNWVVMADEWTEEKRSRFIISDNSSFGEWNWDLLQSDWDVDDLNNWGLDLPAEWGEGDEELEAKEDDFDASQTIETDIVLGDVIEIGRHRLVCGDSTNQNDVDKLMNGAVAQMLFTDPPYDFENDGDYASTILLNTENAHVFVMHDDKGLLNYLKSSSLEFQRFFVADFKFASPRGNDPYLRHILVSHEKNGDAIKHQNHHDGFSSIIKMDYRKNIKDELIHDHQKDITFIADFIKHYSEENFIVLDIFAGGGSTMVASEQLNRICYSMEIEPISCQRIIDRMIKLNNNIPIKINGIEYRLQTVEA